jgi:hypothetical protein
MTYLRLPLLTHLVALCACLSAGDAMAAPATARQMPIDIVTPLIADDGSAYPGAQREPAAEAAAGGPAPGWATQAQRNQLLLLHPSRVVQLHATGGDMALQQTPARDAWVFVDGQGEDAVRLARGLAGAGIERVWVVLPERVAAPAQAAQAARSNQP